jgi:hypothetical protein
MNGQGDGIDRTHLVDRANVVDEAMGIDDISGNELEFLNSLYNARGFVSRIDDDCFKGMRAGIEVTILLEYSNGDAGHQGPALLASFGHALLSFFLAVYALFHPWRDT